MAKFNYSQKLKDPRWQKKRLEIFNRDNFKCRFCGDTESTLHVHHLAYAGEPWEVPDERLLTLCENCHEADHIFRPETEKGLLLQLKLKGFDYSDIASIEYAFYNLDLSGNKQKIFSALLWAMRTPDAMNTLLNMHEEYKKQTDERDDLPF